MSQLIAINELKEVTGYQNLADVEKCLQKNGVQVIYGKKGHLFTTLDAINKVLGVGKNAPTQDTIELL